jgi:FixJ family two-component response regulator
LYRAADWIDQVDNTFLNIGIIAIVDDDEPLREALDSVLKAAGFAVATFPSAEAFLDSPRRQSIVCLIVDIRLSGMSGIELQRRLLAVGSSVPIIFITAHGDAALCEMVMQAGAVGFLTKPVRRDALIQHIHAALRSHPGSR